MNQSVITILLLLTVALAACDQALDAPESPEVQQETPQTSGPADETSEPTEIVGQEGDTSRLMDFFDSQDNLEYQVEYLNQITFDGDTQTSQMTQYFDGQDKVRIDVETDGIQSRTFLMEESFTNCVNQGEWMCFQTQYEESDSEQMQRQIEDNPDAYDIAFTEEVQIAGTTARCYTIDVDDGEAQYCISPEYVPLRVSTSQQGYTSVMEATSYSTSVDESAFDLPAEPMDMADMGAGFPGQP